MKSILSAAIIVLGSLISPLALPGTNPIQRVDVQSRTSEYTILRNGASVGTHRITRTQVTDGLRIVSSTRIDVRFLGLPIYRMSYKASEIWDSDGIQRLSVDVDDDGRMLRLEGYRSDVSFHWSVNDGEPQTSPMPVFPTNHWNALVLNQKHVLNTLTGNLDTVTISRSESPSSSLAAGQVDMQSWDYRGDLTLQSWYRTDGQWMGMRFQGKDGSVIEYRCRTCAERIRI